MLVLIVLTVVTTVGIATFRIANEHNLELINLLSSVVCGFCLLFALTLLPINNAVICAEIQKIKAFQETIDFARENGRPLESAALQIKIAQANEQIAGWQYWNGTLFDAWIPDEVMDLEPPR